MLVWFPQNPNKSRPGHIIFAMLILSWLLLFTTPDPDPDGTAAPDPDAEAALPPAAVGLLVVGLIWLISDLIGVWIGEI